MADPGIITKIVFFLTLLILIMLNSVQAAPATKLKSDSDNNEEEYGYEYDQRQNGTENYRISLKDVVIIWAPANPLLAATALLDSQLLGSDYFGLDDSEKPQSGQNAEKPEIIMEVVEDKPVVENSSVASSNVSSSTELPEKQTTVVSTTEKAVEESRSFYRSAGSIGSIGPIFRRRFLPRE
ncbi:hypothetical protein ILUMI_20852 [Ignelater luminosus]|uniref:Uncharacterized protein n=1 Tax=Ignelater luminosus TaxID=2038154 RepID=A0A8K0CDB8_IGNLU|nr:hypothetical protein ILUMI_20852 [Ignelater luminosus]